MKTVRLIALMLVASLALDPAAAFARAGGGSSMGSRGARTYSAPPPTRTAPEAARPIERSVTPATPSQQALPGRAATPTPAAGMPQQPSFAQRNPFLTGIMGGLVGAGIGSMLFGSGFAGAAGGLAGGLGSILQFALLGGLAWWAFTMFRNRRNAATATPYAAESYATAGGAPGGFGEPLPPRYDATPLPAYQGGHAQTVTGPDEVGLSEGDFGEFERLLTGVQQAWSNGDIAALRRVVTPEMLSYFSEQLSVNTSKGITNVITDVKLEQGDLAEAWQEGSVDYATVAMHFSAVDYSTAEDGRVVEGSKTARTQATETWTFMRQATGGKWLLSAIQQ